MSVIGITEIDVNEQNIRMRKFNKNKTGSFE